MHKKKIIFLLIVFAFAMTTVTIFAQQATKPTYNEIFELQMKIYETKRYIKNNTTKKEVLEKELPEIEAEIEDKKEEVIEKMQEAKDILIKLYGGEKTMWVELYLQVKNIEDIITIQYISDTYTEKELELLNSLNNELKELTSKEKEQKNKQKELTNILNNLEIQLAELEKDEEKMKRQLGMVDDVEKAKKEVEELMNKWETVGLESFKEVFKILAKNIGDLPDAMSKKNIKSKSLFRHEVTLTDKELNQFLAKENKIFEEIEFKFEDEQLKMSGSYENLEFNAVGHYELKSGKEMQFYIDELKFENVRLPQVTIEEMEARYDLGFYPSEILEGAEITDIKIEDGVLKVEVKL